MVFIRSRRLSAFIQYIKNRLYIYMYARNAYSYGMRACINVLRIVSKIRYNKSVTAFKRTRSPSNNCHYYYGSAGSAVSITK